MNVQIWCVGKTKTKWIREGESQYLQRCSRYASIEEILIPGAKSKSAAITVKEESDYILTRLQRLPKSYTFLLDERGKMRSSVQFARHLETTFMHHGASLRFVTGGPFGVNDEVRQACDEVISLSAMVFPHELVRIILLEQIYRAFTILRGESYHHI